jgi:uncharacterized protein
LHIWVDADACPNAVKDVLFRAAERTQTSLTLIANQLIRIPPSKFIQSLQVPSGFDVADDKIIQQVQAGDLVITGDIPLAAEVLARHAYALNPRGEFFSTDTIAQTLTMRDFMDNLRASGVQTGGPPPLHQRDVQQFAQQLDKFLAQQAKTKPH